MFTGNGELLRDANPFRYSGYQFDPETEFYYLKNRYYSAYLGRFITEDVIMTKNRYMYCCNNPINLVDPSGLFTFIVTLSGALIGGIVGGVAAAINNQSILAGIAGGATSGAIVGFAIDLVTSPLALGAMAVAGVLGGLSGGAVGAVVNQVVTQTLNKQKIHIDITSVLVSGGIGAVTGLTGNLFGVAAGNLFRSSKLIFKEAIEHEHFKEMMY